MTADPEPGQPTAASDGEDAGDRDPAVEGTEASVAGAGSDDEGSDDGGDSSESSDTSAGDASSDTGDSDASGEPSAADDFDDVDDFDDSADWDFGDTVTRSARDSADRGSGGTVRRDATAEGEGLIAGRYRLITELGGGAMGVVWRARDEVLGRDVAVKQLRPDIGMSGAQVRQSHLRARREGRIAARLQHPNAVTIFDVAEHDGQPYLIMEYVPSSNLADILATGTVMAPDEVARFGAQLASALAAAHAVGIVHRDIKPGNVLMTPDGTVKLTDFGISRATGDATVTATGEILGTPAYTAPEVAQGHAVDSPADVFSLGATLYAAVEGTPPFGDDVNAMAVLLRVVRNEIRPPRRTGMLTETVMRMLSPEPADRPTMKDVAQALGALTTGPLPIPVPGEAGPPALAASAVSASEVTEAIALGSVPLPAPEVAAAPVPTPAPTPTPSSSSTPDPAVAKTPTPAPPPTSTPKLTLKPTTAMPSASPTTALPEAAATGPQPQVSPTTAMSAAGIGVRGPSASSAARVRSGDARPPREQSRRRLLVAGGALGTVAVVTAVIVALSNSGDDKPPAAPVAQSTTASHPSASPKSATAPAPSSAASSSAAVPPASSASNTPSSPHSTPSSPSTPPSTSPSSSAPPPAGDIPTQLAKAITDYYNLVPGNLTQAWGELTTDYQQNKALGFDKYSNFWNGMQRVTVSDVQGKAPDTVVATIAYYPKNGPATEERTSFTLVQDGGIWKIARSTVLSSRSI